MKREEPIKSSFASRFVACHAISVFLGGWALGADSMPARMNSENEIELPPFVVSATRPWRHGEMPGLEVLSLCEDEATQAFVRGFQRHVHLLGAIFPPDFLPRHATPVTVVLYSGNLEPEGTSRQPTSATTASYADDGAFLLHVDMANVEAGRKVSPVDLGAAIGGGIPVNAYLGFLLNNRRPASPPWLRGGFARLGNLAFAGDSIFISRGNSEFNPGRNPGAPFELLPMEEFFRGTVLGNRTREDVIAHDRQAMVFIHWALLSEQGRNQAAFWRFAARACAEPVTEQLCIEHFGVGFERLGRRLRGFWREDAFEKESLSFRGRNLPAPVEIALRDATENEVLRLRGYSEAMRARYLRQFSVTSEAFRQTIGLGSPEPYFEKARSRLALLHADGDRDPRLLAELGLVLCDGDRGAEARPLLEAAAKSGVVRARGYVELARLRSAEALRTPTGTNGRLSEEQVASILEPLAIAQAQPPALPGSYVLIAETWSRAGVPPNRAALESLIEGAQLFPRNFDYIERAAEVCRQHGFDVEAATLAAHGAKFAPDETTRQRFSRFETNVVAP